MKNIAWRALSTRSTDPNLNKYATANKTCLTFHVLTCTKKKSSTYFSLSPCVFLQTLGGTEHTQSLFSSTSEAFPPSSLPGIPDSILAIENVKNEEKAEEGTTSTAAGRVLFHCTDIPQSPGVVFAQNKWDLT